MQPGISSTFREAHARNWQSIETATGMLYVIQALTAPLIIMHFPSQAGFERHMSIIP
jgi:hypothetical protein